ncbi:MAG: virulence protein [Erysipelotrichia bacterium]|jgi:predicted P-loop ATPase|nr:virulence protein [Erysipelotrichia bacterium]
MNKVPRNETREWITSLENGRVKIKLYPLNEWKTKLTLTRAKTIAPKITNLMAIMLNDPLLKDLMTFNEFAQRIEFTKAPPWDNGGSVALNDDDVMKLRIYIAEKYDDVEFSKDNLFSVIVKLSSDAKYHPIKNMIESVKWDGIPRAEKLFSDYMGAADNTYTRAVARTWLTGAIKRIYHPGCKFELVPVLQGKQGRGKSTLAKALGGEWFTDGLKDMKSKDARDFLRGAWIIELSELSAMRKTEIEEIKQFISTTVDRFRPAYGRLTQEFPRTAVFMATTNDNGYLKDLTGSRRFAPIVIDEQERKKDVFNISADVIQQIWSEALTWYKMNQPVYLSKEIETMADGYREQAQDENPMKVLIEEYLNIKLPKNWNEFSVMRKRDYISNVMNNSVDNKGEILRETITTREVLTELFNRDPQDELRGDNEARKIALVLNNIDGWKQTAFRMNGTIMKGYKKVDK